MFKQIWLKHPFCVSSLQLRIIECLLQSVKLKNNNHLLFQVYSLVDKELLEKLCYQKYGEVKHKNPFKNEMVPVKPGYLTDEQKSKFIQFLKDEFHSAIFEG
jgi:hypothetical protein